MLFMFINGHPVSMIPCFGRYAVSVGGQYIGTFDDPEEGLDAVREMFVALNAA